MNKEFINGVLVVTKEDGSYTKLANNPLTLSSWVNEDEAFCYAFDENKFRFITKEQELAEIEAEKKATVPQSISRLQAKLQLLEIGLLDEVEDLVAQDRKVQLYWKEADNFYRTDSILLSMATTIGLTDEQLDELFIEASKLK